MNGSDYQELAMRTCPFRHDPTRMMLHGVCGLASEAGEVAGILQKTYQGHEIDYTHVKKELGDVMWFVAEVAESVGSNIDEIMKLNIDKLIARYPNGFDEQRSLNREDGDV